MPLKLAVGVKVMVVPASDTVPPVALLTAEMVGVVPSGSLSLARSVAAAMVATVSSAVVTVSATATGASLTGVTVTVTRAVEVSVPSLIV